MFVLDASDKDKDILASEVEDILISMFFNRCSDTIEIINVDEIKAKYIRPMLFRCNVNFVAEHNKITISA